MIDNLEYNTEREHLIIPEYGRHMQKMINYAKSRDTKEERNKVAKAIISVMGNLQPHLRDVPDFQHKLWDQLFIMADFDIDVDSPYPKPSKEELYARPEVLKYPQNHDRCGLYLGRWRYEGCFDLHHCEPHEKVFFKLEQRYGRG